LFIIDIKELAQFLSSKELIHGEFVLQAIVDFLLVAGIERTDIYFEGKGQNWRNVIYKIISG
jgi:hypothetical protein